MNRSAFAIVSGAALLAPAAPARAQAGPTIVIGVPPAQDVVPVLYAYTTGMFARAGLTVQLQQLVNGAAISAAVAGGSLQIGFSSLQGLISGYVRGVPFQLIAPGGVYSADDPYAYMFVRKDSPIASARDLNGKILGSPALKDLDWIANAAWMEQNGGSFKSTKPVEFPNPTLLPALLEGRLDAYSVGQPWATVALDSGKVRILGKSFSAIAPTFMMTGWFATTDYIERNRDTIDRFNRVLREATVYANAHKTEVIPLLAAWTKLDARLISRTMKGEEGQYLDPALIQPMIDVTVKYGLIEKSFNASELISPAALKPKR